MPPSVSNLSAATPDDATPPRPPAAGRFTPRRALRGLHRRPKTACLLFVLSLFLALNVLAFVHAYSMTHFVQGGARTPGPQELSALQKTGVLLTGVTLTRQLNTATPATLNLPYQTHRYRGADGIDYEAWHVPSGGPPWRRSRGAVVLFHGYAGCKSGVLREAEVVRRAGYDAFLVDFRGSGGTSGSVTTVGYREADDVAEAALYVGQKLRPARVVLYGQSMGAAAVLRAVAVGKANPDAVIVESPFDRMYSTVAHRFEAMGVPAFPVAPLLVFWGGAQHGYWAFGHNPADYARSVTCPTLMLCAGADPFIRRDEAESVFNHVAGPKRMLVFEGAGHEALVAADRGKWAAGVTEFLLAAPRGAGR